MFFCGGPFFVLIFFFAVGDCHRRQHSRRSLSNDQRFIGFRFESEPDIRASPYNSILLNCLYIVESSNVRNVRLEWRKDGALFDTRNGFGQVYPNGSLFIENAKSSDEGWYQCFVHVITGDGSSWTYISRKTYAHLPDLPKFIAQPTDQIAVRGHPVVFHCFTPAHPSPVVVWYHKNVPITSGGEFHILPLSNSLEISSVQVRHEGEYKCMVEGAGKRRTSQAARLRISQDSTLLPSDVIFLSSPRAQSVNEGDSVLLECLASAVTTPEIRWLKDSRQVEVDGSRIKRVGISSLLISNVTVDDAALYTCRASNTEDSSDRTVAVQVLSAPHITTHPQDRISLETVDVELECLAAGRPTPAISWFKNGEEIIASEYFVIEPNRLRILGVVKADQGVYQCLVVNDAGSRQAAAQLLVDSAGPTYLASIGLNRLTLRATSPMPADDSSSIAASSGRPPVPSSPLGLHSVTVGSRVISLEWDPPVQRHGNIMLYHVYFKEEDVDRERMFNSSTTSATLTGLQPDTLYLLRVAAENEAGLGKSSDHIKVTTRKEQSVPGRVVNLQAKALGSETIEVRWDPPQGGPAALRYKLFYIKNPPGDDKETQTITSATTYTFHGMEKYTEYLIHVEADGENGSGLSSETISVRTLSDVPKQPPRDVAVEVVTSTSVRVTWKEPLGGVNGDITGYRVRYKTRLRGSKGNTFVIDATEREYTVSGLEKDTQYLIKVAVVNHNGTGEYSDWLQVATPLHDKEEALLGAPRELRPQAGPDFILLSWLPPADESILVRGYQIGWGHNVPDVATARVAGNVLQYKIPNLRSGKDYVVSLRGSNKQGLGFPIYETVRTLSPSTTAFFGDQDFADPASTPVGVRAESVSATAIRVSWTEPDPNAFNTMYTVRSSTSIEGNQMRTVNTSDPWAFIDGLRPATEYEFAVRARSGDGGLSQWSMAARNRTWPAAPSSAPRDLTVLPAASGDPHSVSLNWQPPKYANGDTEEYLVYYTDRSSLPDKDWNINYVPGDRLSHHVSNLLPKAAYYFKIQARNEKGYGPLSPIQSFVPSSIARPSVVRPASTDSQWTELLRIIFSNPMYLAVLVAIALLLILCIVLIAVCATKRSNLQKRGYVAGRKSSGSPQGDLWINHPGGSHVRGGGSEYMSEGMGTVITERLTGPEVVDSPPPRYHALQDSAYGSVSVRNSRTPVRQSVSSYEDDRRLVGRAKPILASVHSYGTEDSQATLSRSYHQSSSSLEGRQRTPQVVYTGTGRHQPIAKIDFNDSPYGSSSAINSATPPLPVQAPPSGPPVVDGYRTLRGTPPSSNPLRSFTQLAGAPPQSRAVVVAAGGRQLPVGRATAQPRVNVANIYSPYASCSSDTEMDKKQMNNEMEMQPTASRSDLQPSNSTEELNAQMENLDTMIDDLQKFQHEFGAGGNQMPA